MRFNILTLMPRPIHDRAPRPGDERFVAVTGRRPVLERAVGAVAERCVDVRRGTEVTGLLTGPSAWPGIPNVTGVRLTGGEEIPARGRLAACRLHAHFLDGEPITGVLAMSGFVNRYRRLVVSGMPVATGIVSVGDAWSCTNPSLGRGITTGLMQAAGTAEVIREHCGDPLALARGHDEMSETRVRPWYEDTLEFDRERMEQIGASIEGRPCSLPAEPTALARRALLVGMGTTPISSAPSRKSMPCWRPHERSWAVLGSGNAS